MILLTSVKFVMSQVTVTGTVLSKDDKSPIPGVNVVEKGTDNGTITDYDGSFSIEVSDPNSILVFSYVGMVPKEYPLKGKTKIYILAKWECFKDFFDSQQINIYAKSGLINNPLGGQIEISSPELLVGTIKGLYSYQTNLKENEFHNGQIEFSHFISTCEFDLDFCWDYKQISHNNDLNFKVNSFETGLNIRELKLIIGYTYLDINQVEMTRSETLSGVLIGIGKSFNLPLHPFAVSKVSFYKHKVELQASIQGGYKWFNSFVNFYKLDSFNEFSIGCGIVFGYRLKRQRK